MSERRVPPKLLKVAKALKTALSAEVEIERLPMDDPWPDQFRIAVVSPRFKSLNHFKRQDLIWPIVNRILGAEELLAISVILAFSPNELEAASKSK
jgi:acid stress-induced BolA-like protein IbaG/YrbA